MIIFFGVPPHNEENIRLFICWLTGKMHIFSRLLCFILFSLFERKAIFFGCCWRSKTEHQYQQQSKCFSKSVTLTCQEQIFLHVLILNRHESFIMYNLNVYIHIYCSAISLLLKHASEWIFPLHLLSSFPISAFPPYSFSNKHVHREKFVFFQSRNCWCAVAVVHSKPTNSPRQCTGIPLLLGLFCFSGPNRQQIT